MTGVGWISEGRLQLEPDVDAEARTGRNFRLATMGGNDGCDQGKAKSMPWRGSASVRAGEPFEQHVDLTGCYPRPIVGYRKADNVIGAAQSDAHHCPLRRVLNGIVEQVGEHLLEQAAISGDRYTEGNIGHHLVTACFH